MRKGYESAIVFDKKGAIFAISTGADFTSEHEGGSQPLLEALTGCPSLSAESAASQIRDHKASMPDLAASRVIKKNLNLVRFELKGTGDAAEAILAFSPHFEYTQPSSLFNDWAGIRELTFDRPSLNQPAKYIVGAWDERSFALRVRGDGLAVKLKDFFDALQEGQAVFAGTFLKEHEGKRLTGVIIARNDKLRPEHRSAQKEAQLEFENKVQLHLNSKSAELNKLNLNGPKLSVYIWPVWANGVGGEVAYATNSQLGVNLGYGPYRYEDLKNWIVARGKTKINPIPR